jgi:hypothetical protein
MDPAEAQEANRLRTTINDYIKENLALMITGNKDLNKDWDAYVKGLDNLNLARYMQIYKKPTIWARNKDTQNRQPRLLGSWRFWAYQGYRECHCLATPSHGIKFNKWSHWRCI